jgi:hypothetical protein
MPRKKAKTNSHTRMSIATSKNKSRITSKLATGSTKITTTTTTKISNGKSQTHQLQISYLTMEGDNLDLRVDGESLYHQQDLMITSNAKVEALIQAGLSSNTSLQRE